jgi:mRNA interferase MazF
MMLRPCDLVLIPFPFTDLSASKKRPVLVLKSPNEQGDFMAVQITSQSGYTDAIVLSEADMALGHLPKVSYVRTSKLITLNQKLVIAYMGKVSTGIFMSISQEVCSQLACFSKEEIDRV